MCVNDESQPPIIPDATNPARGEDILVTASDGNQTLAYIARPTSNPKPAAVLIYPDALGLVQFYKDLALRFAETGITALALDQYSRSAGIAPRDDNFDYRAQMGQLNFEGFAKDVAAALDYLREQAGQDSTVFVTGFCIGGSLTLLTGTLNGLNLAGLIPFYSGLSRNIAGTNGTVLENTSQVKYPLLGLYGEADTSIPPSDLDQMGQNLTAAGVEHEIVVYPGAPHSFFDRRFADFADTSADAWQRVQNFIQNRTAA